MVPSCIESIEIWKKKTILGANPSISGFMEGVSSQEIKLCSEANNGPPFYSCLVPNHKYLILNMDLQEEDYSNPGTTSRAEEHSDSDSDLEGNESREMEIGEEEDEDEEEDGGGAIEGSKSKEEIIVNHNGNSNFVNEMLEQMEVNADGEKTCPICRRVLKVRNMCQIQVGWKYKKG